MTLLEKMIAGLHVELDQQNVAYPDEKTGRLRVEGDLDVAQLARAALRAIRDAESPALRGLLSLSLEEVVDAILNEKSPATP